jgi:hypothetical protein
MVDPTINSKLRMNSGYKIPILRYSIGRPDQLKPLYTYLRTYTKCTQDLMAKSAACAYDFPKTRSRD